MSSLPVPGAALVPLPGGSDGAEVDVIALECGRVPAPPGWLDRPGGPLWQLRGLGLHIPRSRWLSIPIPAFLLRHPTAGVIVVDSGLHGSIVEDPTRNLGRAGARIFPTFMKPEMALPARLAEHGLDVTDIALVVMTHLHWDHTSGLTQLAPGTPVVVDAREWTAFTSGGLTSGYLHRHVDDQLEWKLLDLDGGEPHDAFSRSVDLLGDGSIRLCATRGHAAGHCSLLLRGSGGRRVLLCGDAAYSMSTLREGYTPLFLDDVATFHESLAALNRQLDAHPDTLVACGHDPDVWPPFDPVIAQPSSAQES